VASAPEVPRTVRIHYRRLPDRETVFEQTVLQQTAECCVTLLPSASLAKPLIVDGAPILEPGSPVVWFTYPARWYDIGRFHLADGTFTGHYANILTPVRMQGDRWYTTDLCLDVWVAADGTTRLLDEHEFGEAVERRWVDRETAGEARRTADRLVRSAAAGKWPPPDVLWWDLARAWVAARAPDQSSSSRT
jgi:predicted RNA-binding protein associated with RNAse of E/G family